MPKLRIRKKSKEKILYYPKKNYQSAISILKLLARENHLTTNKIAEKIGKRWPMPHGRAKILLKYLVELNYVEEFGFVSNKNHVCEKCEAELHLVGFPDES